MSHQGFTIDELTKLEGHAKLDVEMEGGKVKKTSLSVFEASRQFESMVVGKSCIEAPAIMQRICGICSVVHTIASIKAVEDAFSIRPSKQTIDLRKLLLYASTIHSHTAHLFFFALPDYLGFADAIEMSRKRHDCVHLAFDLQRLASDAVKLAGGRAIHPVTPLVGGFRSFPDKSGISDLVKSFEEIRRLAMKTANVFAGLELPEFERERMQLCLKGDGYPLYGGDVTDGKGLSIRPGNYGRYFSERTMPHSNAKHASLRGKAYMTGALARLNANRRHLSESARAILDGAGMKFPLRNPFANNLAQAIEMVHFADESLEILGRYARGMRNERRKPSFRMREGEGVGCCEAPRGLLFHHYRIGRDGKIRYANVITPTSQNVASMEKDVSLFIPKLAGKTESETKLMLEMLIRAYDPCFSCSSHFLELNVKKS